MIWAKSMGGIQPDLGLEIAVDDSNNVYLTGTFHSTVDFDPDPDTAHVANLVSKGIGDVFFAKYDPNGNYLFAKDIGGGADETNSKIAIDKFHNIYLSGYYGNSIDLDPGIGVAYVTSVVSNYDIFFAKYDIVEMTTTMQKYLNIFYFEDHCMKTVV